MKYKLLINLIVILLFSNISLLAGEYDDLIGMVDKYGREITCVRKSTTPFIYNGEYRTFESVKCWMVKKDENGTVVMRWTSNNTKESFDAFAEKMREANQTQEEDEETVTEDEEEYQEEEDNQNEEDNDTTDNGDDKDTKSHHSGFKSLLWSGDNE